MVLSESPHLALLLLPLFWILGRLIAQGWGELQAHILHPPPSPLVTFFFQLHNRAVTTPQGGGGEGEGGVDSRPQLCT